MISVSFRDKTVIFSKMMCSNDLEYCNEQMQRSKAVFAQNLMLNFARSQNLKNLTYVGGNCLLTSFHP